MTPASTALIAQRLTPSQNALRCPVEQNFCTDAGSPAFRRGSRSPVAQERPARSVRPMRSATATGPTTIRAGLIVVSQAPAAPPWSHEFDRRTVSSRTGRRWSSPRVKGPLALFLASRPAFAEERIMGMHPERQREMSLARSSLI